ncbi:MAG TPA: glycosyltransferase family 39 protein [Thermoanaerobaculia bacterium]
MRRTGFLLAAIFLCALAAYGAYSHLSKVDADVTAKDRGDDWWQYKQNALDILEHGLTMPGAGAPYDLPGGFLYNYFLAAIFGLFGPNAEHAYVVHAALIVLTAILYFLIGRRGLPLWAAALFAAGVLFMWWRNALDLLFRLLSENLACPLIALSTLALLRARERDSLRWYAATGALLGAVVLTRLNLELIPLALALVVLLYGAGDLRRRAARAAALLLPALAVIALLAIRNGLVSGHYTIFAAKHLALVPSLGRAGLLATIVKRALYCAGIMIGGMSMRVPGVIGISKHLLAATIGALLWLIVCAWRRRLDFIDAVAVAWLICAYGPFAALPDLGAYGMRFQWPTAPFVVFLAMRLVASITTHLRKSDTP